ncbi:MULTISPECIES: YidB family protein [unclassified Psychrobacter]|uniref:YidB family protein n=1 Tax=unclassified Psychrobacter TaxID=196806 RepID=UPI0025B5B7C4|nr:MULTISPECIES: YidB family protein [unclassified Psychrobacter]MDN3453955.1 YidB family protein [Psychrobacter sp. APC 3350]MDN3502696.1 YidB family protein [Psychrobacter sp. 5A.1]
MSLLGNLVSQVARSAMNPESTQRNTTDQSENSRGTGGLGDILGSVLSGGSQTSANNSQNNRQADNGFGLDDILGGMSSGAGGLGDILGSVLGGGQKQGGFGGKSMLIAVLMPMVLSWIKRNGGLSGALSKITAMGHESKARSWMSSQETNDNLDPNDINRLFDEDEIKQVAAHTGANDAEVRQGLAELLPEVMNQLTPNGNLDTENEANEEIDQIISQLSNRLGNFK